MSTRSTIMDINAFRPETLEELDERTKSMIERRDALGPAYRLFYRQPVHVVKGKGTRLWDADGSEYLDVYNNVASVGHGNPQVIEAVTKQMERLNTHSRYLHETILGYAESILSMMPDEIGQIMFQCTGSEANDLAVRVAQAYSGGTGIIVTSEAYHGNTSLVSGLSPALGSGQELALDMRTIPSPDSYRLDAEAMGEYLAHEVKLQIDDMEQHGITFAGFLADSIFSSDGIYPHPAKFLKPVVDAVHEAGGCFIADEVQPGFTRTGENFWGFERHEVIPDIITMGKPMANGIPCAAMAARPEVLEAFAKDIPYFNTFGGNPVSMAAAQATLDYMIDNNTLSNAKRVGAAFLETLQRFKQRYACVGDVRGAGLYLACEIVKPDTDEPDAERALDIVEKMREKRILISVCGEAGNVLKLRPPLVFSLHDLDIFGSRFEETLREVS